MAFLALATGCRSGPKPEVIARLCYVGEGRSLADYHHAEGLLAVGRPDEALVIFRKLHEKYPGAAQLVVQMRRAISLMGSGRQTEELTAQRLALEKAHGEELAKGRNKDPLVQANLAFCVALCTDDIKTISKWCDEAIRLDPDHYFARTLAGDALWKAGLAERARKQLKAALRINNGIAEAWHRLAVISEELGFNQKADEYYETYLRLRPEDLQVKNNYARFLIKYMRNRRGRRKARAVIAELLASDPENLEYRLHEAANYWSEDRFKEAERVYKELLARYPKDARITLNLGNLYLDPMKRPLKALQVYRYLLTQPVSNDPITMLNQSLPIRVRVKQLEKQFAGQLPKAPNSYKDLL